METIEQLVNLLTLEKLSEGRYLGSNYMTPWKRVFGGQVLGQSLHAAYQTVPQDRIAHSMHGYFILTGDIEQPIEYEVDIVRDGGSFTTRRVVAIQKGKAIFVMSASFQKQQEGFDHQITIPNVLPPEVLLPDYDQIKDLQYSDPMLYKRLTIIHPNAIEFRPVENYYTGNINATKPYRHVWFKAKEKATYDIRMQHQLLAYASDYNLLTTAVIPHLEEAKNANLFYASLDHAIWFHREFNIDEWLLYATDSPSASNSRGLSRGSIFTKDGILIASVAQEGLIRKM
jgi:acyl-CoA thioesterase II